MRRIVIDMQNALFADAIAESLRRFDPDLEPVLSGSPAETLPLCRTIRANVLIMEVTGYPAFGLDARLKLQSGLKQAVPGCKTVLVVDENAERKLADEVRQTKKDGLVDAFLYGSVPASYLSAMVDTL